MEENRREWINDLNVRENHKEVGEETDGEDGEGKKRRWRWRMEKTMVKMENGENRGEWEKIVE